MAIRTRTESRLLDAAEELFFSQGIRATPVDAVLARAGVSAATLYRGYASKEELLAAVLDRRQREWLATWDAAIARRTTPRTRLLAVFDALDEFAVKPAAARWCAFLGTMAEYADEPAVEAAARADTTSLRERLTALAVEVAGRAGPLLAEDLLLVVSGHLAMRLREPQADAATARRVAEVLVDARLPG